MRDSLYETTDDRVNGIQVAPLNTIEHPGGNWVIWDTVESWDVPAYPGGGWRGKWRGTLRFNDDGTNDVTVVGEYEGTGTLAGLHLHKGYEIRTGLVTVSGFILKQPTQ